MTIKLLRTIRLDASDTFVFERAAAAGEWAVTGTFMFWDDDPTTLEGREKQAFRSGFLGLESFGWSTLAVVVEASEAERQQAVDMLAANLLERHGAPDLEAARAAAAEEIAFAENLAQHPVQTLVAVHRTITDYSSISEQFRTFHEANAIKAASMPCSAGAFAVVEDGGSDVNEVVDLAAIVAARKAQQS